MPNAPHVLTGKVIVPGRSAIARVMNDPAPIETGYILIADRLTTPDHDRIVRSVGVIVDTGCSCDHATMICRTRGVPVVQLAVASAHLHDGKRVYLNGTTGKIQLEPPFPDVTDWVPDLRESSWARLRDIRFQVSILDESCVHAANMLEPSNIDQFFHRHEFLWLRRDECPFHSILARGVEGTAAVIHDSLLPIADSLKGDQTLNFRSLNARSDEFHFINDLARGRECNPQLGLRGIRHLLSRRELLQAELRAVDMLRRSGYSNVALSLPFVTDPTELDEVRKIASAVCRTELPIGVFVESPAAALKIDSLLRRMPPFLCVGTKDLAQLILGVDRTNRNVRHLYDLADTAVVDTVAHVVAKSRSASVPAYVYTDLQNVEPYLRGIPQLDSLSVTRGEFEMIVAGLRTFEP